MTQDHHSPDDALWSDLLAESELEEHRFTLNHTKLSTASRILDTPNDSAKCRLIAAGFRRLKQNHAELLTHPNSGSEDPTWRAAMILKDFLRELLRSNPSLDAALLNELLLPATESSRYAWARLPANILVSAAERFAAREPLTADLRQSLSLLRQVTSQYPDADSRKLVTRLDHLLHDPADGPSPAAILEPSEPWSDAAINLRSNLSPTQRTAWDALLAHASTATASTPSKKWLKSATTLIQSLGTPTYLASLQSLLPLVGQPGPGRAVMSINGIVTEPTALSPHNADLLKGLVWTTATLNDPSIPPLLGDLAETCFKKLPGIGARCPKVANASLASLSLLPGPDAVAQITRIQSKAKKASARKIVERSLNTSAASQGLSREELEELSIPDFGLTPGTGARDLPFPPYTAQLRVTPPATASLKWLTPAGKLQSSTPADVKRDHAPALKELQRTLKDIEQLLPAQSARLERLFLTPRSWPVAAWRDRYLNHPLLSLLTRRLIWQTDASIPFLPLNGQPTDAAGNPITLPDSATITLWHPIHSPAQTVLAWRTFLFDHQLTQPFKQAHREIYLLTDAERTTDTYSNRFAAHILRQHQFQALCDARGWTYRLMGGFDSHNTPTRFLPHHNLRVEFWVDSAGNELTPAGIFTHVATDQVRFARGQAASAPLPLATIPPLLFSELLRDIDLFVSVCSVANDPTWHDGGPEGRHHAYWQSTSFGDLSESAQTRRAVLESLLPRLTKLAGLWSLSDKFLHIQGRLRSYKIHLGSANILMDPNDQYLCIVPDRSPKSARQDLFLPFEGDSTLSLILSKAFLLANDDKITDPTITRQIRS